MLQWGPAHVGVDYSEHADELEKQGRDKSSKISTVELACRSLPTNHEEGGKFHTKDV